MLSDKLTKGDTIGILSPAGALKNPEILESAVRKIESFGYNVKLSKNVLSCADYLAGSDDERLEDLMEFFGDNEIKAIVVSRGGYGTIRLLDKIDYELIKNNPKIFCGFSDLTNLLNVFFQKTGLITYHSPMAVFDFTEEESAEDTVENFFNVLERKIELPYSFFANDNFACINSGKARGILAGGNLASIVSTFGSGYQLDFRGKILLLEDVAEPLYKIDRMLQQMRLASVFRKVKGVVIAGFSGCDAEEEQVISFLRDFFKEYAFPVFYGFNAGHFNPKYTLPIGGKFKLDADKGELVLLEY